MSTQRASSRAPIIIALALTISAMACATTRAAIIASARPAGIVCQRKPGHTVFSHHAIRVFRNSGNVYGCLKGHTRRVWLWIKLPEVRSSVKAAVGQHVVVQSVSSNQYAYGRSLQAIDLADGTSYWIASLASPLGGAPQADPASPGPWPLEAFSLGSTGLTARLYATFAPGAGSTSEPSGQVLDVIGPHDYDRTLARTSAGAITPTSLAYHGDEVTWDQDGVPKSAAVSKQARLRVLADAAKPVGSVLRRL